MVNEFILFLDASGWLFVNCPKNSWRYLEELGLILSQCFLVSGSKRT